MIKATFWLLGGLVFAYMAVVGGDWVGPLSSNPQIWLSQVIVGVVLLILAGIITLGAFFTTRDREMKAGSADFIMAVFIQGLVAFVFGIIATPISHYGLNPLHWATWWVLLVPLGSLALACVIWADLTMTKTLQVKAIIS